MLKFLKRTPKDRLGYGPTEKEDIRSVVAPRLLTVPPLLRACASSPFLLFPPAPPHSLAFTPAIFSHFSSLNCHRAHPFFKEIDWERLDKREVKPPFVPRVKNVKDTANFDSEFTACTPTVTPTAASELAQINQVCCEHGGTWHLRLFFSLFASHSLAPVLTLRPALPRSSPLPRNCSKALHSNTTQVLLLCKPRGHSTTMHRCCFLSPVRAHTAQRRDRWLGSGTRFFFFSLSFFLRSSSSLLHALPLTEASALFFVVYTLFPIITPL